MTINSMATTTWCLFLLCSPFLCSARDTITRNSPISDSEVDTLVSAEGIFELGFFTPNAAPDNRRYVGIWYHDLNPRTVVWVANRDKPLLGSPGTFGIDEHGNLRVSNATMELWFTSLASSSTSRTLKLMDSGNLVLIDDQSALRLWESFKYPTDTFLPGMKMDQNLSLTSWIGDGDPGNGSFTFHVSQRDNRYVISQRAMSYGRERSPSYSYEVDEVPPDVTFILSNFTRRVKPEKSNPYSRIQPILLSPNSSAKLVISSTGSLEYQIRDNDTFQLLWSATGKCSRHNACENFSSCNDNNRILCKCLPGFKPSNPKNRNLENSSSEFTRISTPCDKTDTFLSLKMMKVSEPNLRFLAQNETECKEFCLNRFWCQACSYEVAENSTQGVDSISMTNFCSIWSENVRDLQEEYYRGRNLFVRVAKSDIESTKRDCEPCGTNIIPYPLSTGPDCGDPIYYNFFCNHSTGQLSFKIPSGNYRIESIDPSTRTFIIQDKYAEYDNNSRAYLQLDLSSPFKMTKSTTGNLATNVEISWDPPQEPTCTKSGNCEEWPNSTCKVAGDGKKRCLCNTGFHWDNSSLTCAKVDSPQASEDRPNRNTSRNMTVMIPLIVVPVLAFAIIFTYLWGIKKSKKQEHENRVLRSLDSEKRVKDLMESVAFQEKDGEGIDVPFFGMKSILTATDGFSDANKLGEGGYGPVYKGIFPGGKEIAIKRLSCISSQGLQEFKNEVVLIAKLQHRNLVRLQGYCIKGEEKILLYEYMPNKSLDTFIFDQKLSMILDWNKRVHIILGIARGLLYLHHDSRLRIIHRDLKTSNILLDNELNPKISDFGLARMVEGKEVGANTTKVVGTYGYMSPEYAMNGLFSIKSDVFSFGVVLLEIVSGKKKNTSFYQSELALSLLHYAWRLWTENRVLDLVDPTLHEICNADQFVKFVNVGLLCVQEDPNDRPTMSNVGTMLDAEVATIPAPKQPAFVPRPGISGTASSSSRSDAYSDTIYILEEKA